MASVVLLQMRENIKSVTDWRTEGWTNGQGHHAPSSSVGEGQNITQNSFWRHDSTSLYSLQSYEQWLDRNDRILDHIGSFKS